VPVVVHTNHGLPFHESQPAPIRATYRALERVASRVTDRIVCVGRDMLEQSLDAHLGPRRLFTVVRSGMEVERFVNGDGAGVRRDLGIPPGAPVVGTVARLAAQKGPEFFLDAVAIIAERVPEAQFVWVGDGPLRESLAARAGLRGLPIRFVGLVPPERVPAYLGAMDVVLMTSLWEGLPRVAVQASLCARPVVAFDAPGVREVLVDGVSGRVATRGDARAMAEMACGLLALPDRGRAMGLEARRRNADEFRWEKMVAELDALYAALAGR
jgi:glycosyltransferase involved in cell wall biosynthesis